MALTEILSYEGAEMEFLFSRGNIGTVIESIAQAYNEFKIPAGAGVGAVFPAIGKVIAGQVYGPNGNDYTGNVQLPSVNDVDNGVGFGASGTEFTGVLLLPAPADVKLGTTYGANGTEFTGTLAGGGGSNIFINLD